MIQKPWTFIGSQDFLPRTQPNSMANHLVPEKTGYRGYTWKSKRDPAKTLNLGISELWQIYENYKVALETGIKNKRKT